MIAESAFQSPVVVALIGLAATVIVGVPSFIAIRRTSRLDKVAALATEASESSVAVGQAMDAFNRIIDQLQEENGALRKNYDELWTKYDDLRGKYDELREAVGRLDTKVNGNA